MSLQPWKPQRIGNLRETITFKGDAEIIGYDPYNEPIYGPPVEITMRARVEPIKGDELVAAGTTGAYHDLVFHTRFLANIKATWEIEWRGKTYNIKSWRNPDERRRFLSIEATGAA